MKAMRDEHKELIDDWVKANPFKASAYRNVIIEECALVAEKQIIGTGFTRSMVRKYIAAAIRALKSKAS